MINESSQTDNLFPFRKAVNILSGIILVLALFATCMGLFYQTGGAPYTFTTLRGEEVTIVGSGLYRLEMVSHQAQVVAQDAVTLLLAIPALAVGLVLANRGSMRGRVLLGGMLFYFLYTYASMSFIAEFNPLFLVYVALFSASLFGLILLVMGIRPEELMKNILPGYPARGLSIFSFFASGTILLMWLNRILTALIKNVPPIDMGTSPTLVIQALDLGVVVPLGLLTGFLLWKRQPWGYMLGTIFLLKAATLALAVYAMGLNMWRVGGPITLPELGVWTLINAGAVWFAVAVLRKVR